jgi:hypothetical protein
MIRVCKQASDLPPVLPPLFPALALRRPLLRLYREYCKSACAGAGLSLERQYDFISSVGEASALAVVAGVDATGRVGYDAERRVVQAVVSLVPHPSAMGACGYEAGPFAISDLSHALLSRADRVWLFVCCEGTRLIIEQNRFPPPAQVGRMPKLGGFV